MKPIPSIVLALAALCIAPVIGAEDVDALRAKLKATNPDLEVESVSATPLPGILAVELAGGNFLYGTTDGSHLLVGELYELTDGGTINLTEQSRAERRQALLASIDPDDMIIFSPKGEPKASVVVFTDVDCSYCRKLHLEMAEINKLGIEVRYLAYPRAGLDSRSYEKIVSAWCSKNPNKALTELKLGNSIPERTCSNPVAEQYQLGQTLGISGTPALLTADGRMLPGYRPAAELAQALGI